MAKELKADHVTGKTTYFQVRSSVGTIWNGSAFETYLTANIATYKIAATEQGTASGTYVADMPAAIPGDCLSVTFKEQAGGAPAESDVTMGTGFIFWDGVKLQPGDSAVLQNGKATAGGNSTITIQTALGADNLPNGCIIKIIGGTGKNQARVIVGYTDATRVVTVDNNWTTNPDSTSIYSIIYEHEGRTTSNGMYQADVQTWLGVSVLPLVSQQVQAVVPSSTVVASVTNPVTVGTNNDKNGYALTSAYDFAKGTVVMAESYAANGVAPTPVQAIFAIHQYLMDFAITGTSYTAKQLNNTSTAFVVTLDSATAPTAASRT